MPASTLALGASDFIQLTTFRRTGEGVPTPVWVVPDGDALAVFTPAGTGKLKRIGHTPRVTVAECSRRGQGRRRRACRWRHAPPPPPTPPRSSGSPGCSPTSTACSSGSSCSSSGSLARGERRARGHPHRAGARRRRGRRRGEPGGATATHAPGIRVLLMSDTHLPLRARDLPGPALGRGRPRRRRGARRRLGRRRDPRPARGAQPVAAGLLGQQRRPRAARPAARGRPGDPRRACASPWCTRRGARSAATSGCARPTPTPTCSSSGTATSRGTQRIPGSGC